MARLKHKSVASNNMVPTIFFETNFILRHTERFGEWSQFREVQLLASALPFLNGSRIRSNAATEISDG